MSTLDSHYDACSCDGTERPRLQGWSRQGARRSNACSQHGE